ncbi:MAG: purine-nucleoside phosphorylase [Desulfuromonadales bacterium]
MDEGRRIIEDLRRLAGIEPFDVAIVLGSGLGEAVALEEETASLSYRELPCFPVATIPGHPGRILAGTLNRRRVLVFQGRLHLYQGLNARQVTLPVRLAGELGCRRLLLTNASGGINPVYCPGDFMFVGDHLNFMGDNPLRGLSGNTFVDLGDLYRRDLFQPLADYGREQGIALHLGTLAGMTGPSYETPAEIRALGVLGADAVSMSTIPEAIMARFLGMEVVALSLIANRAAGLSPSPLSHEEVLETGRRGSRHLSLLLRRLMTLWLPG